MADVIDMHAVRVLCIKKGGSSMQHRAFAEMMFDPKAVADDRVRYLVFFRNPMARLVSAYNHFIVLHRTDSKQFGPRTDFCGWLRWWLDQYPTSLDHHLKLATMDLAETFASFDDAHDAHLMLCPLEQSTERVDEVTEYCYGRRPSIRTDIRHPHAPWWMYYQKPEVAPMVPELRLKVAEDFNLWFALVQSEELPIHRHRNLQEMFDPARLLTSTLQSN